jgi:tripartite ATP-independent transporter DctM subunit
VARRARSRYDDRGGGGGGLSVLVATVVVTFVVLTLVSLPIVFSLGIAGFTGLLVGNFSLQKLPSSLVAGSQSWVLLAIPTFVFAGALMERCGMSYALVDLARALVGWVRGGLGMSVVLAEYFFSGISGSTIADVSAIGAMLTPPMLRAGYKPEHAASLVASATAMGILVPPAIFMIVLGQVTDTSVVALFLAGFLPAAVTAACLMTVILIEAHRLNWPKDHRASGAEIRAATKRSLVPLVVPIVIVLGFYFGVFTATEAGALVAAYAVAAALLYYRNVTVREMLKLVHESALLTAAVVFLLAVASVYQFLMGMLGVPLLLGQMLKPLEATPWLFLLAVSIIVILFGMVLEGLPAAVVLVPVVFPIAKQIGIHPVHFNIVLTAAVGIGLFLPPIGVGLLMALRFANVSAARHFKAYWPYLVALFIGLLLLIVVPEITLFVPRRAGLVR